MGEQNPRVVIAEDDFLVCGEIKRVLQGSRYTVIGEACNGEEAIELAKELHPDAILMDIKMPKVDGLEASRRITDQYPLPIVIMTAYESSELVEQACRVGAGAFLGKPPRFTEIDRALTIAIARHNDLMEVRRLNTQLEKALEEIKTLQSVQQQMATLDRVFFHDLNNILAGMLSSAEMLELQCSGKGLKTAANIKNRITQLGREVELQKIISFGETEQFRSLQERLSVNTILEDIRNSLLHHNSLQGKTLFMRALTPDRTFFSDRHLIFKILTNMVLNALEASDESDEVRLWAEPSEQDRVVFSVWNRAVIPDDVKQRVFQKNCSTKKATGRGLGTYSMKLFGEELLKGKITFSSGKEEGTTFRFMI